MKREDNKRSEIPTTRARTDVKSQTQSREICPIFLETYILNISQEKNI
jgi:hypothetical protein